jgi:hypothetical protein
MRNNQKNPNLPAAEILEHGGAPVFLGAVLSTGGS